MRIKVVDVEIVDLLAGEISQVMVVVEWDDPEDDPDEWWWQLFPFLGIGDLS